MVKPRGAARGASGCLKLAVVTRCARGYWLDCLLQALFRLHREPLSLFTSLSTNQIRRDRGTSCWALSHLLSTARDLRASEMPVCLFMCACVCVFAYACAHGHTCICVCVLCECVCVCCVHLCLFTRAWIYFFFKRKKKNRTSPSLIHNTGKVYLNQTKLTWPISFGGENSIRLRRVIRGVATCIPSR